VLKEIYSHQSQTMSKTEANSYWADQVKSSWVSPDDTWQHRKSVDQVWVCWNSGSVLRLGQVKSQNFIKNRSK